jgi:hypothetical protein
MKPREKTHPGPRMTLLEASMITELSWLDAVVARQNMTFVSHPADSTHWVEPAPATRLIDDKRKPDGS